MWLSEVVSTVVLCASALDRGPGDHSCVCSRSKVRVPVLLPEQHCRGEGVYSHSALHTTAIRSCGGLTEGTVLYQLRDRNG